jgi:pilus assembly protein CpaB
VVLQNVRVLGIDLNADMNEAKPNSPNTATLEVSVADTQKLSMASTLGQLSLALRRTGEAQIAKAPPMRSSDFLGGGPRAASPVAGGPVRNYSAILIIEGESAKRAPRAKPAPVAAAAAPTQPATNGLGTVG